jgi:hypothetical protein
MKREKLTNVETEAQCQELAADAARKSGYIHRTRMHLAQINPALGAGPQTGMFEVRQMADRIISLRSQQVTPFGKSANS